MIGQIAFEAARVLTSGSEAAGCSAFSIPLLVFELARASMFAASQSRWHRLKIESAPCARRPRPTRNQSATEKFPMSDRLPSRSKLEMGHD